MSSLLSGQIRRIKVLGLEIFTPLTITRLCLRNGLPISILGLLVGARHNSFVGLDGVGRNVSYKICFVENTIFFQRRERYIDKVYAFEFVNQLSIPFLNSRDCLFKIGKNLEGLFPGKRDIRK